uniref:Uncharacterized protein n=1 Tax=Laticauda laticaudata TaxID=8630 RepID=A0A8C5S5S9_LATLA
MEPFGRRPEPSGRCKREPGPDDEEATAGPLLFSHGPPAPGTRLGPALTTASDPGDDDFRFLGRPLPGSAPPRPLCDSSELPRPHSIQGDAP